MAADVERSYDEEEVVKTGCTWRVQVVLSLLAFFHNSNQPNKRQRFAFCFLFLDVRVVFSVRGFNGLQEPLL